MHPIIAAAAGFPAALALGTYVLPNMPAESAAAQQTVHIVAPGETLSGIAAAYGTTTATLALANEVEDIDRLAVGQLLVIVQPADESVVLHTVEAGDTLGGIAALYGVEADALAAANDLTLETLILPGDVLIVPV